MSFIEWSHTMDVGIESIDTEHRQLVEIANRMERAVQAGREHTELMAILDELIAATRDHFTSEERVMEEAGYPLLEAHQRMHAELIVEVGRMRGALDSSELARATAPFVLKFIKLWLVKHVEHDDIRIGRFVLAQKADSEIPL